MRDAEGFAPPAIQREPASCPALSGASGRSWLHPRCSAGSAPAWLVPLAWNPAMR